MGRLWVTPEGSSWSYARDTRRGYRRSVYYGIEEWAPIGEFPMWAPVESDPMPKGGWRE